MIMWTMQPYEVYQQLLTQGFFYSDPAKSNNLKLDAAFQRAYQWMTKQLAAKVERPSSLITTPIWAWYRSHDYLHQRPDFRWVRDYPDEVCIEFAIPDEQVLLSDFENWHFVLDDFYLGLATNEQEFEQENAWFNGLNVPQQQRVKEKSWQRIFDITPRTGDWTKNGDSVQGCFWLLKREQIRRVWRLKQGTRAYEMDFES